MNRFEHRRAAIGVWFLYLVAAIATLAAPSRAQSLKFVVYGDTRDGHAIHRKLVALMLTQHPAFVLQTGDLVHTGTRADLWKIYDDITAPIRKEAPIYPANGNHDGGGPLYLAHVPADVANGNPLYYSFDRADCHFVCLAVDETTQYAARSKQYKWLVADLTASRPRAKHIFIYFHVPPYSIGSHGSDLNVRAELCPVFEKFQVSAVFNGHDHNYYRTIRNDIPYIVTGGGGAPLYPCDPDKGAIEGDVYKSTNHILVCDVEGTRVTFTALYPDGTVLDSFSVDR